MKRLKDHLQGLDVKRGRKQSYGDVFWLVYGLKVPRKDIQNTPDDKCILEKKNSYFIRRAYLFQFIRLPLIMISLYFPLPGDFFKQIKKSSGKA